MTEWPDPKADAVGDVLRVLCSSSALEMTLPKILEETKLTQEEVDEALKRLVAYGLADLNEGWVRLSRSSILASLRHELRL